MSENSRERTDFGFVDGGPSNILGRTLYMCRYIHVPVIV